MRKKPKGQRYRNLTSRGGLIYYQRVVGGHRIRFSCQTNDWDEAAGVARVYEQRKGIGRVPHVIVEMPSFSEFAERYLEEDTAHLAPTTKHDRRSYLRKDGPLIGSFGERKLDEITPALLREWWNAEITGKTRSTKTGRAYLDVLASILSYAMDLALLESNPIPVFREQLRRRSRTKGARADADPSQHIRPIESLEELHRLIEAAKDEAEDDFEREYLVIGNGARRERSLEERTGGLRAFVAVLGMLDAGLRIGEVAGLTWGQVRWGRDEDDTMRFLFIDRSRPRGGEEGTPKSGRTRTVALSRRLRSALVQLYRLQFEPTPSARVLPGFHPANFAHRWWRRILRRAEIGHRAPKDLRDTYVSWLLTLGVQLGYVSQQAGHADVAVTARHYARWCGGDFYRDPMPLQEGEVPADLIARVVEEFIERPQIDPSSRTAEDPLSRNPRPSLDLLARPTRLELVTFRSAT